MNLVKKSMLSLCLLLCLWGMPVTAAKQNKVFNQYSAAAKVSDYTFKKSFSKKEISARKKVITIAKSYLKIREKSAKHKELIKKYNAVKKNVYRNGKYRHFKASTSMSWCDIFVSVVFLKANLQNSIGVECGCGEHVDLLKKKKCWMEKDSYVPSTGDLIYYDWDDRGKGDNKGWPDHVGIVVSVSPKKVITVIEGNYDDTVKYRTLKVNSRYIRGFGIPAFPK